LMAKVKGTSAPMPDANDLLGLRRLQASQGPGTSITPIHRGVSQEALNRPQRGPSAAAIAKRNEHAKALLAKRPINKAEVEAIASDPENLNLLLQLTVQRLRETGQAGSIVGKIPPP